jgi:hypothetical protein
MSRPLRGILGAGAMGNSMKAPLEDSPTNHAIFSFSFCAHSRCGPERGYDKSPLLGEGAMPTDDRRNDSLDPFLPSSLLNSHSAPRQSTGSWDSLNSGVCIAELVLRLSGCAVTWRPAILVAGRCVCALLRRCIVGACCLRRGCGMRGGHCVPVFAGVRAATSPHRGVATVGVMTLRRVAVVACPPLAVCHLVTRRAETSVGTTRCIPLFNLQFLTMLYLFKICYTLYCMLLSLIGVCERCAK